MTLHLKNMLRKAKLVTGLGFNGFVVGWYDIAKIYTLEIL